MDSNSILKIKQWREEEYTVHDVQMAEMRLPVGQRFAQRHALSSGCRWSETDIGLMN